MGYDGRSARVAVVSEILHGDCNKILDTIPDRSVSLVVTSPPYNLGKDYEKKRLTLDQYAAWLAPITAKLVAKLKPNGSLCWQVGNYVKDGSVYPLDYLFFQLFNQHGLKLRNRIIWHFNFGLHAQQRLSGRYETLLWFTKSDRYTFNLDDIRVPQLYPGKRHSQKRTGRAGLPSGNPLGKNPSDVWEFSPKSAFGDDPIWQIPNVKSQHPERTIHPCQFPSELAERCILAFTKKNDLVLDPFVGAGTSVIAAVRLGRRGVGIDKSAKYVKIARQRLDALHSGELVLRASGKPVRKPKAGERVATIPKEWKQK